MRPRVANGVVRDLVNTREALNTFIIFTTQLRNDGYGDADDAPEYEQSDDESDSVQFVNAPDNSHLNRS